MGWGDVRYIALQWQFWFLLFLFFFHTFLSVRFRGDALIKLTVDIPTKFHEV
jgi:hypothetical protein